MAERSLSLPYPGVPEYSHIGVRAPPTITTSVFIPSSSFVARPRHPSCFPALLRVEANREGHGGGEESSLALEARLALLEERRHALVHVLGRGCQAEEVAFEDLALALGDVRATLDGLDREAHCHGTAGEDGFDELHRSGTQLGRREQAVDHADPVG